MYYSTSHLALAALTIASRSFAGPLHTTYSVVGGNAPQSTTSISPSEIFSSLLSLADPGALHQAMHNWHPKFADGAFQSDQSAAEAINKESPALATAILELAKREPQAASPPNSTGQASPPTERSDQTSVVVTTAPGTTAVVVVATTETPSPQTSVAPTSTPSASPTTSPRTTTTMIVTQPTSTSATPTTPSSSSPSPTSAAAQTSQPSTNGENTSLFVSTLVEPNGQPTVITSLKVVGMTASNQNGAASPTTALESGTLRDAGNAIVPATAFSGLAGTIALLISGLIF